MRVPRRVPLQGWNAASAVQREEAKERQGGGQSWVDVGPLRAETLSCCWKAAACAPSGQEEAGLADATGEGTRHPDGSHRFSPQDQT